MKLHIYIFRHGKTYYNTPPKRFTGWKDSKLTPEGFRNAKKVARKLKKKKFEVAYQTDLTRSKQTLKEVLKYHPNVKVITDNRMRERSYGDLAGRYHHALIKEIGEKQYKIWHRSYDVPPPGGESIKMVEKRVNAFIKDLLKKMKKENVNVAISAHNNSMRPFRRYFEKLSIDAMMKLENPYDDFIEYVIDV